jgi:hypothetical protein
MEFPPGRAKGRCVTSPVKPFLPLPQPADFRRAEVLGLFFLALVVSLVQFWAASRTILEIPKVPVTDGVAYLGQAQRFQFPHLDRREFFASLFEWGLYPKFLSLFDLSQVKPWLASSTDPPLRAVYINQALLLAASTAAFLTLAYRLIPGGPFRRLAIAILLGVLLLSPQVIVWPASILNETIVIPALLLFAFACLAHDAGRHWGLALVGLSLCLLVFVRDPIIYFVWMFAVLLGANLLLARGRRPLAVAAGVALLLLATALGYARTMFFTESGRYVQALVNVVQVRILPNPEYRAFFVSRGLPTPPDVMQRAGQPAWVDQATFAPDNEVSSEFLAYRNWVLTHGVRTYAAFLLTHPGYLLRSIFYSPNVGEHGGDFHFSISDLFSLPHRGYFAGEVPYPPRLRDFLLAPFGWLAPMAYFAVVLVRYVVQTLRRQPASAAETAAIAAGGAIFISDHTAGWDIWRHTVPFVVLLYLSMIVRIPQIVEEAVGWVRRTAGYRQASASLGP